MRKSKIFVIVVALFLLSIATTYGLVDAYEANAKSEPLTEASLQAEVQDNLTNSDSRNTAEAVNEFIELKKSRINSQEKEAESSINNPVVDEEINKGEDESAKESQEKTEKEVVESKQSEKTTTQKTVVTETKKTTPGSTPTVKSSNAAAEKAAEKAAAEKAAAEKAAAEKAAAEKAAAEKAAAEKAAAEQAAAEKAAAEKAAAEQAAAEKAAAEKAAAEKAAAEKAAAERAAKPTKADGTPNQGYITQTYNLINSERAAVGKSALKLDAALCNAAQLKAEDMMKNDYFAHKSPTYGSAFEMMDYLGISYRTAAENIAYGYRTPEGAMKGFMNSPGHKCNILDEKGYGYTKVGLGYAMAADGTTYWVQLFCG